MAGVFLKILPFLLMILTGFLLKRAGMFKKSDVALFSKMILNLALPCTVITNFNKITPPIALLSLAVLGVVGNLVLSGVGYFFARKETPMGRGFALINTSGFNIGTFAMPFVQTFFGPAGVVATCIFDAGNALMCTGATYAIAHSVVDHTKKTNPMEFVKKIFSSVSLDTYLIMLILSTFSIRLPDVVISYTSVVGAATPFLAMTMIGVSLELRFPHAHRLIILRTLAIRVIVAGTMAILFYTFLPFTEEVRRVIALVTMAPISSAGPAFTERLGGDVAMAGAINSAMILVGILVTTAILMMGT